MRERGETVAATVVSILVIGALVAAFLVWRNADRSDPGPAEPSATPTMTAPAPPSATTPPTAGRCAASADGIPRQAGALAAPLPAAAARAALARLTVAPRQSGKDFCRGAFGPATWPDLDRNGCSTRQDVLVRSGTDVRTARIPSKGGTCLEALSGTWVDAYTGARLTFTNLKDGREAAGLQVDHLVSLYEAWVSGGRGWTAAQRVAFANDLSMPELNAVSGQGNFDKSYRGLDSWTPAAASRCRVAAAYVQVKAHWRLTVTPRERSRIGELLAPCR